MSAGTWPFCSLGSDDTYPYAAAGTEGLVNPTANKQRICVIGAGPSGLGALKIIRDAPQYKDGLWEPVAFEAREDIGGVWYVCCGWSVEIVRSSGLCLVQGYPLHRSTILPLRLCTTL